MLILGLPSFHNSAWGLVKDGKCVRAIAEERLNRIKHYPYFTDLKEHPMELGIEYLFRDTEFKLSDCSAATIPYMPDGEKYYDLDYFEVDNVQEVLDNRYKTNYDVILKFIKSQGFDGKIVFVNHQLSHAAYAYNLSGYNTCDVLSYDGAGCGTPPEVVAGYHVDDHIYEKLFAYTVPHSLGHIYGTTTNRLFGDKSAGLEGKTMGLASYGDPNPHMTMMVHDEAKDMYVATYPSTTKLPYKGVEPFASLFGLRQENIRQRERKPWNFDDPTDKAYADLAASAQKSIEDAGLFYVKKLKKITNEKNLCLTGGVALNSCLNGLIRRENMYEKTFAPSGCNDAGHALGSPMYYESRFNKFKHERIDNDFLGYPYSLTDCKNAAEKVGVSYTELNSIQEAAEDMANELVNQKIIAIFNEAPEFGPRALGHRSIVVDPRTAEMKDTLNARVKFREAYRPFAPFVLEEKATDYFEFGDSDFMLFVAKVTEKGQRDIPAVVHVDNTSRLQTVNELNEPFYSTLKSFYKKTGTPVLLNTSFNVAGEPIVEAPEDAIRCFMGTSIDILYLNTLKIVKETI
jgi:carbamoyltransferase